MGIIGIVGLTCCAVSLSLIVVSCAVPYWVRLEQKNAVITAGLWMVCSEDVYSKEALCIEITTVPGYVFAVRAFVLMGLFLMASSTVLGFVGICVIKENKKISLIAGAISIAAGICMLIGAFVCAGRSIPLAAVYFPAGTLVQYHAGFALAIAAGVVGIIAGILSIRGKSSVESEIISPPVVPVVKSTDTDLLKHNVPFDLKMIY